MLKLRNMGLSHIRWLADFVGVSPEEVKAEDGLEARLRLQKAAFLLKHLRVPPFTSYNFNMYLRGPYSPDLAKEYYSLEESTPSACVALDKEKEDLVRWFTSHDSRWLEVASSIISLRERYPGRGEGELCSILRMSKPWVTFAEFTKTCRELKERELI